MKMSITHGGVKSSIFHPDGEDFDIHQVLDQLVSPLLLAAGFSQENVDRALSSGTPPDGVFLRLPTIPEDFAFVGVFDGGVGKTFSADDILYLGSYGPHGWSPTSNFAGTHPYAARIGSAAHAFALQHSSQTPQ